MQLEHCSLVTLVIFIIINNMQDMQRVVENNFKKKQIYSFEGPRSSSN